jgi:outer membrane protein assembly factor BamB
MRSIDELVFVGLNGRITALDRETGEVIWTCSSGSGYTTLLLDGDRLIVSANGYLCCLDAKRGKTLWKNELKGYGVGIAHLVSVRGQSGQVLVHQAAAADTARSSAQQTGITNF